MIAYLGPFMADLEFPKVLQHITTTAEYAFTRSQSGSPIGLQAIGDPPILAGAIRQLMVTLERNESIYMVTQQRGAWLAAFASHILGMSAEVAYKEHILWASGGDRGHVVFQLSNEYTGRSVQRNPGTQVHIVGPPSFYTPAQPLSIDYALSDALEAELGRYPELTSDMIAGVHKAICHLAYAAQRDMHSKPYFLMPSGSGFFDYHKAFQDTLTIFKIQSPTSGLGQMSSEGWEAPLENSYGLRFLEYSDSENLRKMCGRHTSHSASIKGCTCSYIGDLIHGFGLSIVALMQCRYNPDEIRVRRDIISGAVMTSWCWTIAKNFESVCKNYRTSKTLLSHILQLVGGVDAIGPQEDVVEQAGADHDLLGLSGGAYTIIYSCILQEDCYDESGRLLTLMSGRASVDGAMRCLIVEYIRNDYAPFFWDQGYDALDSGVSVLAAGSYLESHYAPSRYPIGMRASVREHHILIYTTISLDNSHTYKTLIAKSIRDFVTRVHVPKTCQHSRKRPYQVRNTEAPFVVSPFTVAQVSSRTPIEFMALKGNKLEQLIQTIVTAVYVLQLDSCLDCLVNYTLSIDQNRDVGRRIISKLPIYSPFEFSRIIFTNPLYSDIKRLKR